MSERRGMPFEWAFLIDAIQAERDQGITIDTTPDPLPHGRTRPYVIIDAPGHKEFLKNMVTGAAAADAALLRDRRRRGRAGAVAPARPICCTCWASSQVAVLVNKMDLVGYSAARSGQVGRDLSIYLDALGVDARRAFIPISAREGDNIADRSRHMPWYQGRRCSRRSTASRLALADATCRCGCAVQDVYKFDERRIIAGRIESGRLEVGDELMFSPSGKHARIRTIEAWPNRPGRTSAARADGRASGRPHVGSRDFR